MSDAELVNRASDFDADALRAKYVRERDKRLKANRLERPVDGVGEPVNETISFTDDPFSAAIERPSVEEEVDVLILGGGFGGMLAAIQLKKLGVESFRIIEKGGDFAGTWYWNRYPGAQCDVESYMYLPLLEEVGYVPREKYSYQPEIFSYAKRLAEKFELYPTALFQTCVSDIRWDEGAQRWRVKTDRDDRVAARFVVLCGGGQDRPKFPRIPGIKKFKGHIFHTSRWDYDYTGGDATGGLNKLKDKRVAVLGTGATGIQCIPFVAKDAKHLYVLQRTPSVVGERLNCPTDPAWASALTPGWQDRRMHNYSTLVLGGQQDVDLVDDGWTHATRELASVYGGQKEGEETNAAQAALEAELADFRYMNKLRGRVDSVVKDPATAEILKPWYRYFCKRPTFNDEFLPTFNRDNVTLIDVSSPEGIERITERGFVVNGKEYEVDCIIAATGFDTDEELQVRLGSEIVGRGGQSLTQYWSDGARTLYGLMVHGFPNLMLLGTIQAGLTINYTEMALRQTENIGYIISTALDRQIKAVEPSAKAEADYVARVIAGAEANFEFRNSCTPGYFNSEGRPAIHGKGLTDAQFAPGLHEWAKMLGAWREEGSLSGMDLA